jgi:PAS domain S-box-containing protein
MRRALRLVTPEPAKDRVIQAEAGDAMHVEQYPGLVGAPTALRALDDWFASIFRYAPLGMALIDKSTKFLAVNPAVCKMLGYGEAELRQKSVEEITCLEDQKQSDHPVDPKGTPGSFVSERRLVCQSGERLWIGLTMITLPVTGDGAELRLAIMENIDVRKEADHRLSMAELALQAERSMLDSKNTALREVLEQIDTHKRQSAGQLQANVNRVIRPLLHILADKLPPSDQHLVGLLDSALRDLLDPFVGKLGSLSVSLTRRETEVCNMIRNGFSSKQIASMLSTSVCTVHNQRRSIRKKLQIDDGVTNLESFLKSV